jgi:hypothetical protein
MPFLTRDAQAVPNRMHARNPTDAPPKRLRSTGTCACSHQSQAAHARYHFHSGSTACTRKAREARRSEECYHANNLIDKQRCTPCDLL